VHPLEDGANEASKKIGSAVTIVSSRRSLLLSKDIAAKLAEFKVARHQVTRHIVRINKRLAKELDSIIVERRGWCWAMTSFGVDAYKASEKDLLAEGVNLHSASEEET
jgi:hypothetical protein